MANAKHDQNRIPTLIGVSSTDGVSPTLVYVDPTTHRLYVDNVGGGGGGNNFSINEIASGSGTSYTLANTPIVGTVAVYGLGQRLYPTTDYTISGSSLTMVSTWNAGDILTDYQY